MSKKKKFIIGVIIIFLLFILFFPIGIASTFGIRPVTHGCFGFIITREKINLPEGDITLFSTGVREFRYYVPSENLIVPLCIGIDYWQGE